MNENYLGNPNLKRSNVNINYTKEQLEEYIKCAKDPVYFIQQYIQIVNVDKGLVPFKLYDFQNEMVNAVPRLLCYYFIGFTRRSVEQQLLRSLYIVFMFHAHRPQTKLRQTASSFGEKHQHNHDWPFFIVGW